MTVVWRWVRKWWAAVAAAVAVAVGVFLALGAYRRQVRGLGDAVRVEQYRRRVSQLQRRRAELLAQDQADAAKIWSIDRELEANLEEIEAARARANVDNDQLAKEFSKLGF